MQIGLGYCVFCASEPHDERPRIFPLPRSGDPPSSRSDSNWLRSQPEADRKTVATFDGDFFKCLKDTPLDRCKMVEEKDLPFGPLRYLYVGSKSPQKDLDYYTKVLGAEKVWDISSSGTRVAAVRLGKGPLVLLADHRPAGSCIMIFQVESLKEASQKLRKRGWKPEGEEFEIPEGPCYRFNDPSGNALAILQIVRPGVLGISA